MNIDWYDWPVDIATTLTKLVTEHGLTAKRIAETLPAINGVKPTRNAVIGKCKRLGIPLTKERAKPQKPAPAPIKPGPITRVAGKFIGQPLVKVAPAPAADPPPQTPTPAAATEPALPATDAVGPYAVTVLTNSTCRYPIGDPRAPDFRYCLRLAVGNYCPHHRTLMYIPSRPRALRVKPHFVRRTS